LYFCNFLYSLVGVTAKKMSGTASSAVHPPGGTQRSVYTPCGGTQRSVYTPCGGTQRSVYTPCGGTASSAVHPPGGTQRSVYTPCGGTEDEEEESVNLKSCALDWVSKIVHENSLESVTEDIFLFQRLHSEFTLNEIYNEILRSLVVYLRYQRHVCNCAVPVLYSRVPLGGCTAPAQGASAILANAVPNEVCTPPRGVPNKTEGPATSARVSTSSFSFPCFSSPLSEHDTFEIVNLRLDLEVERRNNKYLRENLMVAQQHILALKSQLRCEEKKSNI
jgi:hypothetical protein